MIKHLETREKKSHYRSHLVGKCTWKIKKPPTPQSWTVVTQSFFQPDSKLSNAKLLNMDGP